MENFTEIFKEEADELLIQLENIMMELEITPDNPAKIGESFRCMHTIKGNAAMFGFNMISNYAHELETALDKLREGKIKVTKKFIDLMLTAADDIKQMLDSEGPLKQDVRDSSNRVIAGLKQLSGEEHKSKRPSNSENNILFPDKQLHNEAGTFKIIFRPAPDIFCSGTNPLLLLKELNELGEYTCVSDPSGIPPLHEIDPEICYLEWEIFLTTKADEDEIRNVFVFVAGSSYIEISEISDFFDDPERPENGRLGEILIERGSIDKESLEKTFKTNKKIGEVLVEQKVLSKRDLSYALAEQQHVRRINNQKSLNRQASIIKVQSEKLDLLVDLVGELVISQARLSLLSDESKTDPLHQVAGQIKRLTSNLRDGIMNVRMLPIGDTFNKYRRLIRDLSNELGKDVELVISGGETELDKTIIERLQDPLVHLIRNCMDHGIEAPKERKRAGKPEKGTVNLSACHSGASVVISIADDGKGLDQETILKKARNKGLVRRNGDIPKHEVFNMIFAPGFSTAPAVTEISGRGVGLDVVRREIEELQGMVSVSSEKGKGTCINLKIPLTLSIIDGLLITSGGQKFIIPLASVEKCLNFHVDGINSPDGNNIIQYEKDFIPYISLKEIFKLEGRNYQKQLIIVQGCTMKFGIIVDEIFGNFQTVIKPLGELYRNIGGVSGASIQGDGSIALILDINSIESVAIQINSLAESLV